MKDDAVLPDYAARLRLDGRSFLVVGGGLGMGRQVAHALSSQGATVHVADVDGARADAVSREVGGKAHTCDATDEAQVVDLVEAVTLGGPLHGVVDVVGAARWGAVTSMSTEDYEFSLDIVLRHAFLLLRHAAPAVVAAGGGSLTFVSSVSGMVSAPYHAPYGAAKAGLMSMVRSAALELRSSDVRVNAVAPGQTASPRMIDIGLIDSSLRDGGPLDGPGATSDIAAAILFFASDLARHVTGQTLAVDGGESVRSPYDIPASISGAPTSEDDLS